MLSMIILNINYKIYKINMQVIDGLDNVIGIKN